MITLSEIRNPIPHSAAKQGEAVGIHDLFRCQPVEYLRPERSLFEEGAEARNAYEILDGAMRVFKLLPDGRRVITGFLYRGDIVGVSLGRKYLYSVEAICGTTVRRLARRQLDQAIERDRNLKPELFALVTDELSAAQDQMVLLACKNAEERLCSFLVSYVRRNSLPGERLLSIDLPMCRQDIADYLGMSIETVSRTMTKLINKGVLSIENANMRHTITISDPVLLAQIAGDGDEYADGRPGLLRKAGGGRR